MHFSNLQERRFVYEHHSKYRRYLLLLCFLFRTLQVLITSISLKVLLKNQLFSKMCTTFIYTDRIIRKRCTNQTLDSSAFLNFFFFFSFFLFSCFCLTLSAPFLIFFFISSCSSSAKTLSILASSSFSNRFSKCVWKQEI